MRAAIRYSEYKGAGKLPHKMKFDCSECFGTPKQEVRNCRGEFETRFNYQIGTTLFFQCPVSVFGFDKDVIQVIDLISISLETGQPVAGTCLLDQTGAFYEYANIIRSERKDCYDELEAVRKREESQATARNSVKRSRQRR